LGALRATGMTVALTRVRGFALENPDFEIF
jgi:hypothetical protein